MGPGSLDAGTRIAGRYVVDEVLGAGGMGVVVRARDERLGRSVAVKVLPPKTVGDAHARERLIREARSAASFEHPGIIHIYDVGETDDGGAFLVMELVKGRRLTELLSAGRLGYAERWRVLIECARALGAAHRAGLVHRDVKPDNVMVRDDGRAVLLDFGLAKPVAAVTLGGPGSDPTVQRLTAEGSIVGTPAYLAPEQAQGFDLDGRADQFALAVVAYEILTGHVPWAGSNPLAVLAAILTSTPVAPSAHVPALGPALDRVLDRALSKNPDDRFEDMDTFADALSAVPSPGSTSEPGLRVSSSTPSLPSPPHHDAAVAATMPSMPTPPATVTAGAPSQITPTPVAVSAPAPGPTPSMRARARRRWPWMAAFGGVAIGLVSGGFGYRSWQRHHPLSSANSVLACPIMLASGADEPTGWLGAAASQLACDRVAVMLGAQFDRTLVPAELLNLPHQPAEEIPSDPYGIPEARERTVREARSRADTWLDGAVVRSDDGFRVSVAMRSPEGAEVSPRVVGRGRLLYQAVRDAMDQLARRWSIPQVQRFPTSIAPYEHGDVATELAFGDLMTARDLDARATADECANLDRHRAALGRYAALLPVLCAERSTVAPPAVDTSSPALLATTATIHFRLGAMDDPRRYAERIHADFDAATEPEARGMFAGAEARLWLNAGDAQRAREIALAGVRLQPHQSEGWRALSESSREMLGTETTLRAWAAWLPSDEAAWRSQATSGQSGMEGAEARVSLARRASVLAPDNAEVSARLGETLLRAGHREEARGIAASLLERDEGDRSTAGTALMVAVEASEGRFGDALSMASTAIDGMDRIGRRHSDLPLMLEAVDVATLLGQGPAFADGLYSRFGAVDPPRLNALDPNVAGGCVAVCLAASADVAPRCLARVRELVTRGFFASVVPGTDALIDGADHYLRSDLNGAAAAWRPLMRSPGRIVQMAAGPMVAAFDRVGEPELADRVDASLLSQPGAFNGADLTFVRAARRAAVRGEPEKARRLAQRVIDAWAAADPPVNAVDEMRALLVSLTPADARP